MLSGETRTNWRKGRMTCGCIELNYGKNLNIPTVFPFLRVLFFPFLRVH